LRLRAAPEIIIDPKLKADHINYRLIATDQKIPARVQQPRAYTKSRSIEPVDGARNNRFIAPISPFPFRLKIMLDCKCLGP